MRWFRNLAPLMCVALLFPMAAPSRGAERPPSSERDTRPGAEPVAEAVAKIREMAFPEPSITDITRIGLRAYLRSLDPYSDFLPGNEFEQFRKMKRDGLFGVGMDIEITPRGGILCMPHPDSPAETAGIRFGELLTAVDGVAVTGRSLLFAASLVTGGPGKVVLSVRDAAGKERTITVSRVKLQMETMDKTVQGGIPILRISAFAPSTPRELRHFLAELASNSPLVIDVRRNHGGDLLAAIESAMPFLPKDQDIVTVRKKREIKTYRSYGNAMRLNSPLFLWQDRETASAAEVFLAALVQNRRAISIGTSSFGKGVTQDVIELSDGSGMILTTGDLVSPDGTRYHGKGIAPLFALPMGAAEDAWLEKTKECLKVKSSAAPTPEPAAPPSPGLSEKGTETAEPDLFLCFDKEFETEARVHEWLDILERSIEMEGERYPFQRNTGNGIRFFPCLGPYDGKERADKARLRLSKAIIVPMFIRTLETLAAESPPPAIPDPGIPANGGGPEFP